MAETFRCELDDSGCLSLANILKSFNSPINEEQAWAICYQCSKMILEVWKNDPSNCYLTSEPTHVKLNKDGTAHPSTLWMHHNEDRNRQPATSESELVDSLGMVIYTALDYGLGPDEERSLSPPLQSLLDEMTHDPSDVMCRSGHETDEGIEEDQSELDDSRLYQNLTLCSVLERCSNHLNNPSQADGHYKAVCRALVAEAVELSTFLEKISKGTQELRIYAQDEVDSGSDLECLRINDWARLWVQVIHELRTGVKLKKVEIDSNPHPIEYALTPYEILMDDIRRRRYKLNKVMINGDIPKRVKKDAHAIILEFIRSRPPLRSVKERKLPPAPPQHTDPYEQLMVSIRQEHRLKPTPGKTVETSRTKLNESDLTPQPTRRLIKADLSLLNLNSFDQDDDDDDTYLSPSPEGFKSLPPLPLGQNPTSVVDQGSISPWQKTVALDMAKYSEVLKPDRRHSITLCETPKVVDGGANGTQTHTAPSKTARARWSALSCSVSNLHQHRRLMKSAYECMSQDELKHMQWKNSMECLSLTLEEVVHIRSVLTKAELESLIVDTPYYEDVSKGKLCFVCRKTKFSFFGPWGQKCKLCKRTVCEKCSSKMRIPTDHFASIPVYMLSPSPSSSSDDEGSPRASWRMSDFSALFANSSGSAPASPVPHSKADHGGPVVAQSTKTSSVLPTIPSSPDDPSSVSIMPGSESLPIPAQGESNSQCQITAMQESDVQKKQRRLLRSQTLQRSDLSGRHEKLCGALMNVCKECKAMVCHIIVASRTSLMLKQKSDRVAATFPLQVKTATKETRPSRDLNLNLSRIY